MQTTSDRGIVQLVGLEGIVPAPYLDSKNIWTFGIGHTVNAGGLDPAKMPRGNPTDLSYALSTAIQVFDTDLQSYEERVRSALKVPVAQHQFDALVSFDFNTGGIFRANLTKLLNAGASTDAVADAFYGWLVPPEIRSRRTAEAELFRTGTYQNRTNIPVYGVNTAGKLLGATSTVSATQLLAILQKNNSVTSPSNFTSKETLEWSKIFPCLFPS